jgi:hypothetical protein
MKKALTGPAKRTAKKRTAKKKPERRAMIAATRRLDRAVDRQLQRAWPSLSRAGQRLSKIGQRFGRTVAKRMRPLGVLFFRLLSRLERGLLRGAALAGRVATRASAVLTPQRTICLTIVGSSACLIVAQFVDYRAVEIGQSGYAGLSAANAPTVGAERAGEAHAFLLIPVAVLAAALALAVLRNERRRGLGRVIFALGLLSLAVILLVDLPAGLDTGSETSRFSGAKAVLYDGFYAQIAAAAGLMLGGALLSRTRKPRLARTQGGRRSARTLFVRKQGGRPRTQPDEGLQRPAATMRGRA